MDVHPVVATALELQPLICQHLLEGERNARLAKEVVTAVGKAGLFRALAPREVGGLEVSPSVWLADAEAVSAADPAVAWYLGHSMPACLAAAFLDEKERKQLFAEPDRHFGYSGAMVGRAIPADGGYCVSGQWPVVTGGEDAQGGALTGLVMEGDQPRLWRNNPAGRLFLIQTKAEIPLRVKAEVDASSFLCGGPGA